MKLCTRVLCLLLVILTVGSLCACSGGNGNSSQTPAQTPEQEVRSCVEHRGRVAYMLRTIGGNELISSQATVTNVKKISDTKYEVSGRIVMTDVYGTQWSNTFDCEVNKYTDSWSCSSFDFTNSNWQKG